MSILILSCLAFAGCSVSSQTNPIAQCAKGVEKITPLGKNEAHNKYLIVCKGGNVYEVGE